LNNGEDLDPSSFGNSHWLLIVNCKRYPQYDGLVFCLEDTANSYVGGPKSVGAIALATLWHEFRPQYVFVNILQLIPHAAFFKKRMKHTTGKKHVTQRAGDWAYLAGVGVYKIAIESVFAG
jgi:hypothetical protein